MLYTWFQPSLGESHAPKILGRLQKVKGVILGLTVGFYDGFFGPGTGSFLIFLFIRFFGFDFLHASAAAKVVNVATNLAALSYFVPHGYLLPVLGISMAGMPVQTQQVPIRL